MKSPGQVVVFDAGLNAAPLIQEVVLVALAPAVVEHLAFASVAVVEEPTHSVEKKLNMDQTWKYTLTSIRSLTVHLICIKFNFFKGWQS